MTNPDPVPNPDSDPDPDPEPGPEPLSFTLQVCNTPVTDMSCTFISQVNG